MTQLALLPSQHISTFGPTMFKTDRNQQEVRCGMCGTIIYVDAVTFNFVNEAINAGLDDPFRCELCKEEYDDLAYEG